MKEASGKRKRATRLSVQTEHALARGATKSPLLPHERDESPEESTRADPLAVQAHADLARGLVDTERRQDATAIFNSRKSRRVKVADRPMTIINRRSTMRIVYALVIASVAASVSAILPPPSPEAKAQADLAKSRSAWTDKVSAYQLCRASDRVAERYRTSLKTSMKDVPPAVATPPCVDPGPYVAEAKPLEAAGAHSPPGTATSPPNTKATAAELAGGVKK